MENNTFINESLLRYEGYKLRDMELISTVVGESCADSLYNAGISNIHQLGRFSLSELLKLSGIGKSKVIKLLAMQELAKRNIMKADDDKIQSPKDAYALCKDMISEDQEILRLFCLNSKNKIITVKDLFKGGIASSLVDVRILLKEALRTSCASILIAHNHPSGDPQPSKEDIQITQRVAQSCRIMGINFLDHIVVGDEEYVSLKEKCIID